jgi:hypothetical protein
MVGLNLTVSELVPQETCFLSVFTLFSVGFKAQGNRLKPDDLNFSLCVRLTEKIEFFCELVIRLLFVGTPSEKYFCQNTHFFVDFCTHGPLRVSSSARAF